MSKALGKVAHIFTEVDMRCSHLGLVKLLEEEGIEVGNNFVFFLNRPRTMVKIFCKSTQVLLHYRTMGHRRIDPAVLPYLPNYINGPEIKFNAASKKQLEDYFQRTMG